MSENNENYQGRFVFLYTSSVSCDEQDWYSKKMSFRSSMQAFCWKEDMMRIKHSIADKNYLMETGHLDTTQYEIAAREWLLLLEQMIAIWGLGLIPLDIRNGVHSVQSALDFPLTSFGADLGAGPPMSDFGVTDFPAHIVSIEE